ncbi:CYTH domain [Dillenia turbinata]|uniref:CYTH domain n=1 Tax=Dillenia turbinata TaxID=194707 RepID=A0AAN8ZPR8_9MAGN
MLYSCFYDTDALSIIYLKANNIIVVGVSRMDGVGEESRFEINTDVFEWKQLTLELDLTFCEFGTCFEIECKSEAPEKANKLIEQFLEENGICIPTHRSQFAVFQSEKCDNSNLEIIQTNKINMYVIKREYVINFSSDLEVLWVWLPPKRQGTTLAPCGFHRNGVSCCDPHWPHMTEYGTT